LKLAFRTAGFQRRYDGVANANTLKNVFNEGAPKRHAENISGIKQRCAVYGRLSSSKQKKVLFINDIHLNCKKFFQT